MVSDYAGAVLLDTNVISFLLKGDNRADVYAPYLEGKVLALSFMTVAELYQWSAMRNWGERRIKALEDALKEFVILPFDIELCRWWGRIRAVRRAKGRPISSQDAWIAATALTYRLTLVTHNPADFEGLDLDIVSALTK